MPRKAVHTHSMIPTEDPPEFMGGGRTLHPRGAGEQPPNHLPTASHRGVQDGADFGAGQTCPLTPE